jgi:hypothetical protein
LLVTPLDDEVNVIEAYLVGNRLVKLLSSILPSHRDYFSPEIVDRRNQSRELLIELLKFMEDLAWLIDEEQHTKFVKKSRSGDEDNVASVSNDYHIDTEHVTPNHPSDRSESSSHDVPLTPSRSEVNVQSESVKSSSPEKHSLGDDLHEDDSTIGWDARFIVYEDQASSSGPIVVSSNMDRSELLQVETPTFELCSTLDQDDQIVGGESLLQKESDSTEEETCPETEWSLQYHSVDPFSQVVSKETGTDCTSIPSSSSSSSPSHEVLSITPKSLPPTRYCYDTEIQVIPRCLSMPSRPRSTTHKVRKSTKSLEGAISKTQTKDTFEFVVAASPTLVLQQAPETDLREPIIRKSHRFSDDDSLLNDKDFQVLTFRSLLCKGRLNSFKGCIKTWFVELDS